MRKPVLELFHRVVAQTVIQFPISQIGLVGKNLRKPALVSLPKIDLADYIKW